MSQIARWLAIPLFARLYPSFRWLLQTPKSVQNCIRVMNPSLSQSFTKPSFLTCLFRSSVEDINN